MKVIIFLSITLLSSFVFGQEQNNLINKQLLKVDTVSHTIKDTISTANWRYYKFTLTADSSIYYKSGNDSTYINNTEVWDQPDWLPSSLFPRIILWKQSSAAGTTKFRLWIWGK